MSELNRREFLMTTGIGASLMSMNPSSTAQMGSQGSAGSEPWRKGLPLRFRQVHLDFHTSEHIPDVGKDFDPEEFAATLEKARVNSVTCFGRCHHGWIYYDTKAFPERRHPTLRRNLLKEQIEACHKRNIRVPIYVTIQWDHYTAQRHPEWWVLDENGYPTGTKIYEPGFYRNLCVNTPYTEFLRALVKEILETLPVDGFFFDIVRPLECSCYYCRRDMKAQGLDPSNAEHRRQFALQMINNWKRSMTQYVRQFNKDCTIFYNAGHIGPRHRAVADAYTHWELESLPSGGWGYLDFPLKVRYTRTLNMESLGMTGKFHTSWGDFHSFKNRAALEFECFQMLALGAKCSIGDQLHPSGKIDPVTYELIGSVYRQVEEKEPWCEGAVAVTDVGVLTPEEFLGGASRRLPPACWGFTRMLQELQIQFDVLDSKSDFTKYKLLILPDNIPVDAQLRAKLQEYLHSGGALLATYESGKHPTEDRFNLPELGVELVGDAPYSPDFIVPEGPVGEGLPATEHVMYLKGKQVKVQDGTEVLAYTVVPYFNRTWEHFCSHRHTPSSGKRGYPAITRRNNVIYFIHPVFTQYHQNAPLWCKRLVGNAIKMLLPEPVVRVDGPSSLLVSLNEQPEKRRRVLHLLHYIPERRGEAFDVIEDVILLRNLKVSLRQDHPVKQILLVPQNQALQFSNVGGRIAFTVPELKGHQMVSIEYA